RAAGWLAAGSGAGGGAAKPVVLASSRWSVSSTLNTVRDSRAPAPPVKVTSSRRLAHVPLVLNGGPLIRVTWPIVNVLPPTTTVTLAKFADPLKPSSMFAQLAPPLLDLNRPN